MMNNFNRFPSSSPRPIFPAYDRDYLSRTSNQSPFEQTHHPSNKFDLGRSIYSAGGPVPMPGSTRNFSDSFNTQRFLSPQEMHAKYLSKGYKHGPETRLPPEFSEANARKGFERQENDHFSSHSPPNAFLNQSKVRDYRDNYLDDRDHSMFENSFSPFNTRFKRVNVPPATNERKLIDPVNFESDRNFMSQNFNNSLKETSEVQSAKVPDESILMRVQEIKNLQDLLKLSNDLSLIDEISSNSSQHSPAVFDENSMGKNIDRNTSHVKQQNKFASAKDAFKNKEYSEELYELENSTSKFFETFKSTKSLSDANILGDKKFVKNNLCDIQENDLYSDSPQVAQKVLENRIVEMLTDIPKVSRHTEPVFSTSFLFEKSPSSCPIKKDDDEDLYSSIDQKTSKKVPYIDSDLHSEWFQSPKSQLRPTTLNSKLIQDPDWSTSKTIPFLYETPDDKLANRLKGKASEFQAGTSSRSVSGQNSSEEIGESDSCKSYLEEAIDVLVEKEAVVGLDYIIEYKNMVSKKGSLPFFCKLCNSSIGRLTVVAHVIGSKHRLNYLKAKDEETYRNIMSRKLKIKEKDAIISEAIIPLEKRYGRGRVIVQIKEIKAKEEIPIPVDNLIEVVEDSSMTATSNEDAEILTDYTNSSIKRSVSENDKAVKLLKVEKKEDMQGQISELDSITHDTVVNESQTKRNSQDSKGFTDETIVKSANLDDQKEMEVTPVSGNFDISGLLNALANHSISSEEEADTISKVIGVLLKSLLHFKLQTFKNVNLEQLMASLSNGSEEALLKLLALLESNQQEAQKINIDIVTETESSSNSCNQNSSHNPCSSVETSDAAKEQNNEDKYNSTINDTVEMSKVLHILPPSGSAAIPHKITSINSSITSTSAISTSQPIVGRDIPSNAVSSTPVSQVAPVTGLVPPAFFGWSNPPASTLANQSPSKAIGNCAWASPYPMMQMPGMPYYQQPAGAFQQSIAAYSGYSQYGVPVSQSNTATGNFIPPRLPLIAQPPPPPPLPPPMTTPNQPPLPSPICPPPPPMTTSKQPPLPSPICPPPPPMATSKQPPLPSSICPPPPPSMPPLPPMYPPPPPLP